MKSFYDRVHYVNPCFVSVEALINSGLKTLNSYCIIYILEAYCLSPVGLTLLCIYLCNVDIYGFYNVS